VIKPASRTFNLVIRALPGTDAIRELRRLLKRLLRQHGFRAVTVEKITDRRTQGGENGERENARA
jgi:hypothetical protein